MKKGKVSWRHRIYSNICFECKIISNAVEKTWRNWFHIQSTHWGKYGKRRNCRYMQMNIVALYYSSVHIHMHRFIYLSFYTHTHDITCEIKSWTWWAFVKLIKYIDAYMVRLYSIRNDIYVKNIGNFDSRDWMFFFPERDLLFFFFWKP